MTHQEGAGSASSVRDAESEEFDHQEWERLELRAPDAGSESGLALSASFGEKGSILALVAACGTDSLGGSPSNDRAGGWALTTSPKGGFPTLRGSGTLRESPVDSPIGKLPAIRHSPTGALPALSAVAQDRGAADVPVMELPLATAPSEHARASASTAQPSMALPPAALPPFASLVEEDDLERRLVSMNDRLWMKLMELTDRVDASDTTLRLQMKELQSSMHTLAASDDSSNALGGKLSDVERANRESVQRQAQQEEWVRKKFDQLETFSADVVRRLEDQQGCAEQQQHVCRTLELKFDDAIQNVRRVDGEQDWAATWEDRLAALERSTKETSSVDGLISEIEKKHCVLSDKLQELSSSLAQQLQACEKTSSGIQQRLAEGEKQADNRDQLLHETCSALKHQTVGLDQQISALKSTTNSGIQDNLAHCEKASSVIQQRLAESEKKADNRDQLLHEACAALKHHIVDIDQQLASLSDNTGSRLEQQLSECEKAGSALQHKLADFEKKADGRDERLHEACSALKHQMVDLDQKISASDEKVRTGVTGTQVVSEDLDALRQLVDRHQSARSTLEKGFTQRHESLDAKLEQQQSSAAECLKQLEKLETFSAMVLPRLEEQQARIEQAEQQRCESQTLAEGLEQKLEGVSNHLEHKVTELESLCARVVPRLEDQHERLDREGQELSGIGQQVQDLVRGQKTADARWQEVFAHADSSLTTAEKCRKEQEKHQRDSLRALHEFRAEARMEMGSGLRRLAEQVAERLQSENVEQSEARCAVEKRAETLVTNCETHLKAFQHWQAACDQRQAGQEHRLAGVDESIRRIANDIAQQVEVRLSEMRAAMKIDLNASAFSAFEGELKIWNKMAQLGIAHQAQGVQ